MLNPVFLYSSKRDEIQKVLSEDMENRLKKCTYMQREGSGVERRSGKRHSGNDQNWVIVNC